MQLDDRCGSLRSVVVGKWMSRILTVRWVNRSGLQRVVHRLVVAMLGQSVQRVVRGLDAALLERRGRSRCWQLGRVESSELVTKTEPCLSTTDQVNGQANRG